MIGIRAFGIRYSSGASLGIDLMLCTRVLPMLLRWSFLIMLHRGSSSASDVVTSKGAMVTYAYRGHGGSRKIKRCLFAFTHGLHTILAW